MAAFEEATMVKSLPVIPRRTSLSTCQIYSILPAYECLHDECSLWWWWLWWGLARKSFGGRKFFFGVMEGLRSDFEESESLKTIKKVVREELRRCGVLELDRHSPTRSMKLGPLSWQICRVCCLLWFAASYEL
jgi:hypothetical protein